MPRSLGCGHVTALQASNLYSSYDQYFAIVGYWDRVEFGLFGHDFSGILYALTFVVSASIGA